MALRKTLILSIDGLSTRDLGAYGGSGFETPAFDRLAARSLCFEHVLTHSTRLEQSLESMVAPIDASDSPVCDHTILRSLREDGLPTVLLTDSTSSFPQALVASGFQHVVQVPSPTTEESALDWELTHCAEFFAQLLETRREFPRSHLLWAHYGGLGHRWDAPYSWRERMADESDPAPPRWISPPVAAWPERRPDEQLGLYQAWAAEIMVLDACLSGLWEELGNEAEVQFVLVSPRGYPLGEHRIAGLDRGVLYSEATAVPLFIAEINSSVGWRSQNLVQPSIVAKIIRGWHSSDDPRDRSTQVLVDQPLSVATCAEDERMAIRTAEWMLIHSATQNELYAKPDDRWEFNDVSSRCPEVVEHLLSDMTPSRA